MWLQMRRTGLLHQCARGKAYQKDTLAESNEEAALCRQQIQLQQNVNCPGVP
jgi:hypothetical protein